MLLLEMTERLVMFNSRELCGCENWERDIKLLLNIGKARKM